MNSDEVFLRAALYEECAKSSILKHIDIDSSSIETLRELLNKNNALVFRKLPIILSKLVVKHGLTFAKSKISQLHFLTPENINVNVESDELQYLLETQSSMKPNIIFMVSKNILLSVVGSSIASFKDELLSNNLNNDTEQSTKKAEFTKISVKKSDPPEWSKAKTPTEYTNVFDTPPDSIKSIGERLRNLSRSSSRSSISSKSHNIQRKRSNSQLKSKEKVKIISDIVLKEADNDKKNTETANKYSAPHEYSDMEDDDFSDENNEDVDDEQCVDVKLSDLQETRLKSKSEDFYEMVNSVVPQQNLNGDVVIEDVSDDESENYTPKSVKSIKPDNLDCEIREINEPKSKEIVNIKSTPQPASTKIITIDDDDEMFNANDDDDVYNNNIDSDDDDDEDDII